MPPYFMHIGKNINVLFYRCDIVVEKSINAACTIVYATLCTAATRLMSFKKTQIVAGCEFWIL